MSHIVLVLLVEHTDWLAQIAIDGRIGQIERLGRVVAQYPGKDRILAEIVVGAAGYRVEYHEILEVAYLVVAPALRVVAHFEQVDLTAHARVRVQVGQAHGHYLAVDFIADL